MNNQTLDTEMFSDLEPEVFFTLEDLRFEEAELYYAINEGVL